MIGITPKMKLMRVPASTTRVMVSWRFRWAYIRAVNVLE
jgi:hypothetical protein